LWRRTGVEANKFLEAALQYAEWGWKVLPLRERSKIPFLPAWPKKASCDESVIRKWWDAHPDNNVGVRLGEPSGIIDCECDSPEEEQEYWALWGNDAPPTASFQSSELILPNGLVYAKKHFILQWRAGLPGKATLKYGKLIIKTGGGGRGTQSVFPPSVHPSGFSYRWLAHPNDIPPAAITDETLKRMVEWEGLSAAGVLERIDSEEKESCPSSTTTTTTTVRCGGTIDEDRWKEITDGSDEGSRNVDLTSYVGYQLQNAKDIETPKAINNILASVKAINERNRPPLEDKEVKTIFLSILRRERERRLSEDSIHVMPESAAKLIEREKKDDKEIFSLTIIQAEPPVYKLFGPQFEKAKDGCLRLNAEQLQSPRLIRIEALKQAEYPLPKTFDKAWTAPGGLYERLVFAAKTEPAPPEEIRSAVIAEKMWGAIRSARALADDEKADETDGNPIRMSDGSIIFIFTRVWENMSLGADKVARHELSQLLNGIGVERALAGGYYRRLSVESQENLRKIAENGKP
jgi:hypothetical protein